MTATAKRRRRGLHSSKRVTWQQRWREFVWPSMGLRAWLKWLKLTLMRQAHQPHEVALGFAVGVWAVFFPVLGTHMILSIAVCWLLGGSVLAAVAGNWIGNPWTYPIIWWASHKLGVVVLHLNVMTRSNLHEVDPMRMWGHLERMFAHVLWPMTVGGELIGVPVAVVTYFVIFHSMKAWNKTRKGRHA